MTEKPIYQILRRLYEKSRQGDVAWQDTYRESRFAVYLSDSSMTLQHKPNTPFTSECYIFTIANERGTVVDEITTTDSDVDQRWVAELYELARRKALGVEARLDSVLETLEQEGVIGEDAPPGAVRV